MYSVDGFHIEIKGKGSHGAYPQNSIDPINIAAHVYLALQSIIAREVDPSKACLMTVGKFQAGTAANIIPDTAVLEGTWSDTGFSRYLSHLRYLLWPLACYRAQSFSTQSPH